MRSVVEREFGSALDELTSMRDRARDELDALELDAESLRVDGQVTVVVLGIYSRVLTYLDCIRVLAERGYGEESLGLARSIYESEADAYLLFAKPCLLDRYSDFEVYQHCLAAARIEADGTLVGPEAHEHLDRWRRELKELAQQRKLDLPPDFADTDLRTAVSEFSRKRFGNRFRGSWRYDLKWRCDILPLAVEAHEMITDASAGTAQVGQLDERIRQRAEEHDFVYAIMSNELHGSPKAVAERVDYPNFRLGGDPQMVPFAVGIAAVCFDRLQTLVRHLAGLPAVTRSWTDRHAAETDTAGYPPQKGGGHR
ncbi:MAG: hypothetical protein F4X74_01305 [Acidimicrobiia bacterium]|nr:hypothetical protein [Acidimicrobiia bacterium]